MSSSLYPAILGCGNFVAFWSWLGIVGVLFWLVVACAIFGLFYGVMRIFCRPKRAGLWTLALLLIAGIVLTPPIRAARINSLRTSANCHLKQIGLLMVLYSEDHQNILPLSLHDKDLKKYFSSETMFTDPETGDPFVYVGAGKKWMANPDDVIAYSPHDAGGHGRTVLFSDGHVTWLTCAKFAEALKDSGIETHGR